MKATSIRTADTRIIPASKERKAVKATKGADGSLAVEFGNGQTGVIPADEPDMQAFLIYTMLNSECTRP